MFGALMVWEMAARLWAGHADALYSASIFHFTYVGFDWLRPMPGPWMRALFVALAAAAAAMALDVRARRAAALFALGYTYAFLLDAGLYQNHYYLIALLSWLFALVPLDRWWALAVFRFQIGVVYFYGATAKLASDWLQGEPIRLQLSWQSDPILTAIRLALGPEGAVWFFAYGGFVLDLLVVPALLWRRTRPWAVGAAIVFHLLNAKLWDIGVFPWLMIAATLLFLDPSWPRRLMPRLRPARPVDAPGRLAGWARISLIAYVAIQLLVPLRDYAYPGNASWTGEGDRFAWRMKLRSKRGAAKLFATDPARGTAWEIDPSTILAPWQRHLLVLDPDFVRQVAHEAARRHRAQGGGRLEVRAHVIASLNGRAPQLLIDRTTDLAAQPRGLAKKSWIVPLTQPLTAAK